jgi:large subunit ribosomal protein L17
MRHNKRTAKLGMKSQHRRATLANLVGSLIKHNRITTTIAKAKVARRFADKMVTLAKKGTVHHRRQALAFLGQKDLVAKLFADLGKQHSDRQGGYTRIIRVGNRPGDAAEMAILEWTGTVVTAPEPAADAKAEETKGTEAATTDKAKAKPAKKTKPKAEKTDSAAAK